MGLPAKEDLGDQFLGISMKYPPLPLCTLLPQHPELKFPISFAPHLAAGLELCKKGIFDTLTFVVDKLQSPLGCS